MTYEDSHLKKENSVKHVSFKETNVWTKCGVTKVIFPYKNKISNILKNFILYWGT